MRVEPILTLPKNAPESAPDELIHALDKIVNDVNSNAPVPRPARERHEFVSITENAVKAIIGAHEDAVTKVQNRLEAIKVETDQMLTRIKKVEEELAAELEASRVLGEGAMTICKTFHGIKQHASDSE